MTQPPNLVADVLRIVADATKPLSAHSPMWAEFEKSLRADAARLSAQTAAGAEGVPADLASKLRDLVPCPCLPHVCMEGHAPKGTFCKTGKAYSAKPLPMEAVDRIGLACSHGKDPYLCGECNARPPSPTTAGAEPREVLLGPPPWKASPSRGEPVMLAGMKVLIDSSLAPNEVAFVHPNGRKEYFRFTEPGPAQPGRERAHVHKWERFGDFWICSVCNDRITNDEYLEASGTAREAPSQSSDTVSASPTPAVTGELRGCPWCNGPVHSETDNHPAYPGLVHCPNGLCPVRPEARGETEAKAIAAWNTRARTPAAADGAGGDAKLARELSEWADQYEGMRVPGRHIIERVAARLRSGTAS